MRFVQRDNKSLTRFRKSTVLVLAGVVIGAISVLIILVRHQPDPSELKEIRLQYTVKHIKSEQARLGIDCHALRKALQDFLIDDVHPVLRVRQPGQDWIRNFSQDAGKRMGDVRDYYFACGRLYHAAQSVQWDEFKDIDFTESLDGEIITLNTLIRFGESGEWCDAACLDWRFREMQVAVSNIERRLNGSKEQSRVE